MAFEDPLHSMHDQALRPRLLYTVMGTHLPDDKQLPRAPGQLSVAVASIRRHHLLWESSPSGASGLHFLQGTKGLDSSKVAVDAWMEKLLSLLSSTVVCSFLLVFDLIVERNSIIRDTWIYIYVVVASWYRRISWEAEVYVRKCGRSNQPTMKPDFQLLQQDQEYVLRRIPWWPGYLVFVQFL